MTRPQQQQQPDPAAYREPIATEAQFALAMVLLRHPDAYDSVRGVLRPADFGDDARPCGLVLSCLDRLAGRGVPVPPSRLVISGELARMALVDPDNFDYGTRGEITSILDKAYGSRSNELMDRAALVYATEVARNLRQEAAARELQRGLSSALLPADLPLFIRKRLDDIEQARSVGVSTGHDLVFPDGWDETPAVDICPTGSDILDNFLGGGHGVGRSNIFLAPIGAYKTTMAVQCVANSAEIARDLWERRGRRGPKPVAVLVSSETPIDEFRVRVLGSAACIHLDKLKGYRPLDKLSDGEPTDPAEREFFAQQLADNTYVPARRRAEYAKNLINEFVHFVDLTGTADGLEAYGRNGIADVIAYLKAYLRRTGNSLLCVWVDHASAIADRQIAEQRLDARAKTEILKRMPLDLRDHVARPMQTRTWLVHQLTGKANSFGPGAELHHTDAAGCASFGEYAYAAIVGGQPTGKDNVAVFRYSKHREGPPQPPRFGRVYGDYGRVVDATDDYRFSHGGRSVVRARDADRFWALTEGGPAPAPAPARPDGGYEPGKGY